MKLKIMLSIIICLSIYNLYAQNGNNHEQLSNIKFIKEISINENFYGIHIKKCPGQISGDKHCIRTLYLLNNQETSFNLKQIKKGIYTLQENQKIVLYDKMAANFCIQYSDLTNAQKNTYLETIEQHLIKEQLLQKQKIIQKRRKTIIYHTALKHPEALFFYVDKEFLNQKLKNRIKICSQQKQVPVIILL